MILGVRWLTILPKKVKVTPMFRNVIAPVQAWLLSQGRCVGCGTDLSLGTKIKHSSGEKITCQKCGRIFIKELESGKYRRALFEEV